jgi:hypothetical protein
MFDIVHNLMSYFVLIRGETLSMKPLVLDNRALIVQHVPEDHGAPQQPHPSGVQPQDVPVTEAHDGKMVVY